MILKLAVAATLSLTSGLAFAAGAVPQKAPAQMTVSIDTTHHQCESVA